MLESNGHPLVGLGKAQGITLTLDAICCFCRVRQFLQDFVLGNVVGDLALDQKATPAFSFVLQRAFQFSILIPPAFLS